MDEVDEGATVGCRRPTKAANEPAGLAAEDELLGVLVGQRRDPEPGLADELGEHAAGAEGDERAEDRVLDDPREELGAPSTIGWTRTGAPMRSTAARTASSSARSSASPPTSVLWAPGERGLHDDRETELASGRRRPPRRCLRSARGRAECRTPEAALASPPARATRRRRARAQPRRCACAAWRSMPSSVGTVPCGRRSQSARSAARPSARAADSG